MAATGSAQALAPTPVFAPPLTYEAGNAGGLVIADFTGDGRNDVLVRETDTSATERPDRLYLFSQGPDGRLARTEVIDLGTWWNYGPGIAAGDLDGDGLTDAAVVSGTSIELLLQRGGKLVRGQAIPDAPFRWGLGGTFTALADELRHDYSAMPLRAGDVDGDGLTDLVAVEDGGALHTWVQRNGRPVRGQSRYLSYTRFPSTALALADFTGDGRLDVATANYNAGVEVLRNVTTSGAFHPLPPARILDTRTGLGAPAARLGAGGTISLQVAGAGGVPVGGATAVVLNVTVTEPTAGSFLTAWPTSENRPVASNLNFVAGQTVPNLVTVSTGLGGKVDLYNLAGST